MPERDWRGLPPAQRETPESPIYVWRVTTRWEGFWTDQKIRGLVEARQAWCAAGHSFQQITTPEHDRMIAEMWLEQMTLREYLEGKHG